MKKLLFLAVIALVFAGCSNNDPAKRINELEKQAFLTEGAIVPEVASDLVSAYCDYADANPNDAMSPEYLFKAVDVSMNLNEPQRTISIIDKLMADYPDYPRTQAALFVKAFIFETKYNNLDMAKKLYEQYLEQYPDGEFADDCRASIEFLGLSPEELVKRFEAQEAE
ncbi:MAG: membrane lipoprotein lipid attachment site-containing protein [Bacteroidales bacterium]|nr:membrane lipoprotein lipid attachment site-containing protein [Bacteroidales bacterium]